MSLNSEDWTILKRSTMLLFIAILGVVVVIGGSNYYYNKAYHGAKSEIKTLAQAKTRLEEAKSARRLIEEYLPRFSVYQRLGVMGEERRMSWIEAVRKTTQRLNLPSIEYKINAQKLASQNYAPIEGDYKIQVSEMNIKMQLLHEGDLFSILSDINKNANGLFHVSGCELGRLNKEIKTNVVDSNINSSCDLQWYTINYESQNNKADIL